MQQKSQVTLCPKCLRRGNPRYLGIFGTGYSSSAAQPPPAQTKAVPVSTSGPSRLRTKLTDIANLWSQSVKVSAEATAEYLERNKKTCMLARKQYAINSCVHVLCEPTGDTYLKDGETTPAMVRASAEDGIPLPATIWVHYKTM